jgi:N,N'-diacetyllegionaminate synthase
MQKCGFLRNATETLKSYMVDTLEEFWSGQYTLLVAEVGINHNGNLDLARRSIEYAALAGANAVKFQNYRTEEFLSDRTLSYEYISQGKKVVESQFDMFKRCELKREWLPALKETSDQNGVLFLSTPMGEEGLQDLISIAVPMLKNGSDCLQHIPLIRSMAQTGLPTIISTGMATFDEIREAVEAYREAGGKDLILMHCTSAYPAPPADVNLRRIPLLAKAFTCPVGLSDHSAGIVAALGSVALGARMIEKHFTVDRNLPGPDQRFSADPAEFKLLVDSVRELEACLGSEVIAPAGSERQGRGEFRLSCVASRDLPVGHVLTQEDIAFRRPGYGLPPKAITKLLGRTVPKSVKNGYMFTLEI